MTQARLNYSPRRNTFKQKLPPEKVKGMGMNLIRRGRSGRVFFTELIDYLLLVDVFKDVRGIDEKVDCPTQCHAEKDIQLETVDD